MRWNRAPAVSGTRSQELVCYLSDDNGTTVREKNRTRTTYKVTVQLSSTVMYCFLRRGFKPCPSSTQFTSRDQHMLNPGHDRFPWYSQKSQAAVHLNLRYSGIEDWISTKRHHFLTTIRYSSVHASNGRCDGPTDQE